MGIFFACCISLPTTRLSVTSGIWTSPSTIDVDSEAYCWRRGGFLWRMRASLGLACAQATTLASQVFGKGNPRSRAGRLSI